MHLNSVEGVLRSDEAKHMHYGDKHLLGYGYSGYSSLSHSLRAYRPSVSNEIKNSVLLRHSSHLQVLYQKKSVK